MIQPAQASRPVVLLGESPIQQLLHYDLHVLAALVLVVEVVGVLPDIDAEEGFGAGTQRGLRIGTARELELALPIRQQPGPARAELATDGLREGDLGICDRSLLRRLPRRSSTAICALLLWSSDPTPGVELPRREEDGRRRSARAVSSAPPGRPGVPQALPKRVPGEGPEAELGRCAA